MKSPKKSAQELLFAKPGIGTHCEGVPVYSFGYTHVYGQSPDLLDDTRLQLGANAPAQKIRLKKSAEISSNLLGGTTPRLPRTVKNDYLPLEPVHLIDGDPTTCWSSVPVAHPDAEPGWIRVDLPKEQTLTGVALVKRIPGAERNHVGSMTLCQGAVEVGMAIPDHLEVRLCRDGMTWETVFCGSSEANGGRCEFAPRKAKQIWILGSHFKRVENWHFSFSVASVEVYDEHGRNVALISRGAGVTVSSTYHSAGQTREEHHRLWPIFSDLGLKWIRIGYHDDPINWHWVEREKGRMEIDPEADAAVTQAVDSGIDIVLSLGFGNRLYTQADPSRKLPQLAEWYYENPAPPTTPEGLEAWGRYVRFMCQHFRDRVKVFEVWNEWNGHAYWGAEVNVGQYVAIARTAIPIIREECPEAQVMLGSTDKFCHGIAGWSEKDFQDPSQHLIQAVRELARDVDLIGWHPFYQADFDTDRMLNYRADVLAFKAWARQQGFTGECACTEYNYGANYPVPVEPAWWGTFGATEIEKAKYVARISTLHTALNMGSFFCEVWGNPNYPLDLSLMRRSFAADPISPYQPQAAYYVMRNLATLLEGAKPDDFGVQIEGNPGRMEVCSLFRENEKIVALWLKGRAKDDCPGVPVRLTGDGAYRAVIGCDCMNGIEQTLQSTQDGGKTVIEGVLIRDYPILIRFMK